MTPGLGINRRAYGSHEPSPEEFHSPIHSSHTLPLSSLAEYLEQTTQASVIALGIQAEAVHFDSDVSDEVSSSIREVVSVLKEALCTF